MREEQREKMTLTMESRSRNEAFARAVVAAFVARLDPTLEELEDIRIHSVAVAFQLTYFETRYDAESEEGLELEPEETQAPSGLANADASNLQRSDLETAAEAALGE